MTRAAGRAAYSVTPGAYMQGEAPFVFGQSALRRRAVNEPESLNAR